MKKIIFSVISVLAAVFLLGFSGEVREAVSKAISDCLEIIVPSLFAFSALSFYLQKSGLYKTALKPFTFLLSKILRTNEELCGIFLLSNIGGYPVGASLLSGLVRENRLDRKDAAKLMCCCFGSGPSFIIGMVGKTVFNSARAGAVLFLSCFLSSLVMAAVVFLRGRIELKETRSRYDLSAGCFIDSVSSAARAMFAVCTMIVIFSVIMAALGMIGANRTLAEIFAPFGENAGAVFSSLLEVTRIKDISAGEYAMPICAALLSFGGVCVALQTTAIVGKDIPLGRFLLSRIPASALSAVFSSAFVHVIPSMSEEVLAGNTQAAAFSGNAALSACLIAMCAILLLGNSRDFSR
ncbi:MAG: hypothetical protein J1F03_10435 [Oscillospiraceae bacterium]|nr:hypothetical protein [Oscillospiraceae bacterium]